MIPEFINTPNVEVLAVKKRWEKGLQFKMSEQEMTAEYYQNTKIHPSDISDTHVYLEESVNAKFI